MYRMYLLGTPARVDLRPGQNTFTLPSPTTTALGAIGLYDASCPAVSSEAGHRRISSIHSSTLPGLVEEETPLADTYFFRR